MRLVRTYGVELALVAALALAGVPREALAPFTDPRFAVVDALADPRGPVPVH